ncbi:MAG: THUMP domain-containing protein [Aeropyrum sp.]|nr:THUMP domain-containing protein [Aeropyrum sp.]MCE4616572.1 THUMP domain-containing protein [Aeropyrum sp.]
MFLRRRRASVSDINLIVSFLPYRDYKDIAIEDLRYALGRLIIIAVKKNVIFAKADYNDPLELKAILEDKLPEDSPVLRAIPVLRVVSGEVREIRSAVHELLERMPGGTFAIRLESRVWKNNVEIPRLEAIKEIAEGINREVNLSNPDIIVLVKPFRLREGAFAAIYVGPPDGVYSAVKRR